jgi:hypothetical protein
VGALCIERGPISEAIEVGGTSVAEAFDAVAAAAGRPDPDRA